jgi:DNA polymerase-3 subunit delta'
MAFEPQIAFDYLRRAHESDRLGHAYLLIGGAAASDLAARLACLVVNADGPAAALAHPDVHQVEPESKSRRISVEQMREMENALRLRASAAGGRKVGIVREADRLQVQASNAFLKTLEEPPAHSLLLLITAQPEVLLETILSRCIKVTLRDAAAVAPNPEQSALLELLARHARERADGAGATLAAAYVFTREFTALLGAARARVQEEQEAALEGERDHYAKTTDGSWLAERDTYYKSLIEARYLAERARLLELLSRWWGDVLRCQTADGVTTNALNGAAALASQLTVPTVLRKISKIEELRENLERNIQEALALEVAFLQVFGE